MRRGYAAACMARWSALVERSARGAQGAQDAQGAQGVQGAQGAQGARKHFIVHKSYLLFMKTNQEIDMSFREWCFG